MYRQSNHKIKFFRVIAQAQFNRYYQSSGRMHFVQQSPPQRRSSRGKPIRALERRPRSNRDTVVAPRVRRREILTRVCRTPAAVIHKTPVGGDVALGGAEPPRDASAQCPRGVAARAPRQRAPPVLNTHTRASVSRQATIDAHRESRHLSATMRCVTAQAPSSATRATRACTRRSAAGRRRAARGSHGRRRNRKG